MDVTPELHVLESFRNERLGWHDCTAELIDNSLDAGATRVELVFAGKSFAIRDDGSGCSDIGSMVRFGSHRKHATTALGQYGIGVKHAWMWLSDAIDIQSTRDHKTTRLRLSIGDIRISDGRWIIPDPIGSPATEDDIGTAIRFEPLRKGRTIPDEDLKIRLGRTFMPAIQNGKQIVIIRKNKRTIVKAHQIPPMAECVDEHFEVDGKRVQITIGIAQEGEAITAPGFCLCFRHRVLKFATLGCGNYSSSRMVGTIRLGTGWKLTPHKNDLADYSDELEQAIFSRIEHLLEKAERQSEDIESRHMRHELETMVNSALRDAKKKERRPGQRGQAEGAVIPQDTKRKRRRATEFDITQPGSVEVSGDGVSTRRRGIKLDWCTIEPERIGQVMREDNRVLLNLNNEFVAKVKAEGNLQAMFSVGVGLLCHDAANSDGEQPFLFEKHDFISSWGVVMASLKFGEPANAK